MRWLLLLLGAVAWAAAVDKPIIAVFYNLAMMNEWRPIAKSQFQQLRESGILNASSLVSISALGNASDFSLDALGLDPHGKDAWKFSVHKGFVLQRHEYPTLERLQQYCNAPGSEDSLVLYFHSKGVNSDPGSKRQTLAHNWREYMQYFVFWQWRDCAHALTQEHTDVCGVDYHDESRDNVGFPHFSGNFWYVPTRSIKIISVLPNTSEVI